MKTLKIIFALLACISLNTGCAQDKNQTKAEKQGWHLSMQSFTFHLFTVTESLDKTKELGICFIEIFPGQKIGDDFGDIIFNYDLDVKEQERLVNLAAAKGIKIISSGVWTAQREEWDRIFSFAKNMGMEYISAEPAQEDWDIVEKLAKEYNIKVAVHNHPSRNSYWRPEILLGSIEERDDLLGACVDVGHYKRMHIEPVSAIKQLEGQIISLHFKDIAPHEKEESFEDVVWGEGILNVKKIMKELKRQSFKGYFTIEYEAEWENNLPQIKESLEYFNKVADNIL